MPSINSPRWNGEEQTTLHRAINDPEFQRLAAEHGFKLNHMQNWLRNHEVPASFRSGIRNVLITWGRTQPQTVRR